MEEFLRDSDPFKQLWPFIVVGLSILLYTFATNKSTALRFVFAGIGNKERSGLARESSEASFKTGFFLNIFFFLSLSLFIYSVLRRFQLDYFKNYKDMLLIFGIVVLSYLSKYGFIKLIGVLFKTSEVTFQYIEATFLRLKFLGLALFPISLLVIYLEGNYFIYATVLGGLLFAVFYLMKCGHAIKLGFGINRFPKFYSFLYICTLEILPILIMVKTLVNLSVIGNF